MPAALSAADGQVSADLEACATHFSALEPEGDQRFPVPRSGQRSPHRPVIMILLCSFLHSHQEKQIMGWNPGLWKLGVHLMFPALGVVSKV